MHNKPCQKPPFGTHCNDKPMIYFEPETYPQNSKDKFVHIKIPFKNGRILLEDDIVGNYIRKNEKDHKGKPVIEKVESQLEYTKRPTYIKKKPVEKLKVGKVLIKHVDPITGRVTYEVQDNIPSNVLEEYNKEINKEVIKDNEFITYGDMKNLLNKDLDRIYSRLTSLETTMTKALRILHYLQNGVLPPYKDEITLPKPGEPIPDIPENELPPLSEYTPPFTPDPDPDPEEPEEPEDPNKTIDIVIKVGDIVTPIYPEDKDPEEPEEPEEPKDPDNPDNPDAPDPKPITPIATVILPTHDTIVNDIMTIPFTVYDPDKQWNKLTLLVKLPNNDYYATVKQLELSPDPDVDGDMNATIYYIPKEEGEYNFKLVHYVIAISDGVETEVAVDIEDFVIDVLARDPNDIIPTEDVTINNDLLTTDPNYIIKEGDTINYEFVINHPERVTGNSTLSITEPGSIVPNDVRDIRFSVSKGKLKASTEVTFSKPNEYKLELNISGIEQVTTWYVDVAENGTSGDDKDPAPEIPEESKDPDNTEDGGTTSSPDNEINTEETPSTEINNPDPTVSDQVDNSDSNIVNPDTSVMDENQDTNTTENTDNDKENN